MPKLPRVSGKALIAALLRAGFTRERTRGDHVRLRGPSGEHVTVVATGDDLPIGTLANALRQAGWRADDLRKHL